MKPKKLSKVMIKIPDLHTCSMDDLEFVNRMVLREIARRVKK